MTAGQPSERPACRRFWSWRATSTGPPASSESGPRSSIQGSSKTAFERSASPDILRVIGAVSEPCYARRCAERSARRPAPTRTSSPFVFAPEPIIAWESANGPDVNRLPYVAGLPGLATIKTLLKYALDCGVGPSLHAISKHAANLTKLLTVQTPDELLVGLAAYKVKNPQTLLTGIHFFPFGGLKRTADWLNKIVEGGSR